MTIKQQLEELLEDEDIIYNLSMLETMVTGVSYFRMEKKGLLMAVYNDGEIKEEKMMDNEIMGMEIDGESSVSAFCLLSFLRGTGK